MNTAPKPDYQFPQMDILNPSSRRKQQVDDQRAIVHRTRGHGHGPITRMMSPSDLGEILKPFVFLDHIDARDLRHRGTSAIGLHPHSGIATLTWLLEGAVNYEDNLGMRGKISSGHMEWMHAGRGAWHGGDFGDSDRLRGFQLWIALPPSSELGQAYSRYIGPESISTDGPVTVLLGQWGQAKGPIESPSPIDYFSVTLRTGQAWRYQPPRGYTVAWAAVSTGQLLSPAAVAAGEMVTFAEGEDAIEFVAAEDTDFVFGSAAKHPHDLAMGSYSVHTSEDALRSGESHIREIARGLRAQGRL